MIGMACEGIIIRIADRGIHCTKEKKEKVTYVTKN
jgi:hypothetical protein